VSSSFVLVEEAVEQRGSQPAKGLPSREEHPGQSDPERQHERTGTPIEENPTCAACGKPIRQDDIICPHCGTPLVAG